MVCDLKLSVFMQGVIKLIVIMLNVTILSIIKLSGLMPIVLQLNVIILSVAMLNIIMLYRGAFVTL